MLGLRVSRLSTKPVDNFVDNLSLNRQKALNQAGPDGSAQKLCNY
jgi:hypothetical protein